MQTWWLFECCLNYFLIFQVLDNTISKVADEVLSPEELEERQLKIQASNLQCSPVKAFQEPSRQNCTKTFEDLHLSSPVVNRFYCRILDKMSRILWKVKCKGPQGSSRNFVGFHIQYQLCGGVEHKSIQCQILKYCR